MPISIRIATKRDIPVWASMRYALWPDAGLKDLAKELPGMLKNRRLQNWIAMDGPSPIGFTEASIRDYANGCDSRPVAFLEGIWVRKSHRKKGIGKKLVKAVESWAARRGLVELGSDAYLRNRASHACHLGWGFEETERVVYFRKKLRRAG